MSLHNLFSPSSAHRWINCPGSMAFPENRAGGSSSTFADDGTASHEWASQCLRGQFDAVNLLGSTMELNGETYTMDDERAMYVQVYLDWAREKSKRHRPMFVEVRLDMRPEIDTDGTTDVGDYDDESREAFIGDLKYGVGERVYATKNAQGLSYAVGFRNDLRLLGYEPETYRIGICQPRLDHIDEWVATNADLDEFALYARQSMSVARRAIGGEAIELEPGDKTCRWCAVRGTCPALRRHVESAMAADFDIIADPAQSSGGPELPVGTAALARAYAAIPLILLWIKSVNKEVEGRVAAGEKIIGKDDKPLKFVEGKQGDRKWDDEVMAAASLQGHVLDIWEQPKLKSPTEIEKLFKACKKGAIWGTKAKPGIGADLVKRAPGRPKLALGSDERPDYTGAIASADDFEVEE